MAASDLLLTGPIGDALGWGRRQLPASVGGGDVDPPPKRIDTGSRRAPVPRPREPQQKVQDYAYAKGGPVKGVPHFANKTISCTK